MFPRRRCGVAQRFARLTPYSAMLTGRSAEGDEFFIVLAGGCNVYVVEEAAADTGSVTLLNRGVLTGTLLPGHYFGEISIVYKTPRPSTVVATGCTVRPGGMKQVLPTLVMKTPRPGARGWHGGLVCGTGVTSVPAAFNRYIRAALLDERTLDERVDLLHKIHALSHWRPADLINLAYSTSKVTIPQGSYVARAGAPVHGLHIVIAGQMRVRGPFQRVKLLMHALGHNSRVRQMDTVLEFEVAQAQVQGSLDAAVPKLPAVQKHVVEVEVVGPYGIIGDTEVFRRLDKHLTSVLAVVDTECAFIPRGAAHGAQMRAHAQFMWHVSPAQRHGRHCWPRVTQVRPQPSRRWSAAVRCGMLGRSSGSSSRAAIQVS